MFEKNFYEAMTTSDMVDFSGEKEHFKLTLKENPDSYVEMFFLERGVAITFNHIRDREFSTSVMAKEIFPEDMLVIHLCMNGRCDMYFDEDDFVAITNKKVAFSSKLDTNKAIFPSSEYDGISYFISPKILDESPQGFFSLANIKVDDFFAKYNYQKKPYFSFTSDWVNSVASHLWEKRDTEGIGVMQSLSAVLIHEFRNLPESSVSSALLNRSQTNPIEACKELMCKDLSRRYTVKELAEYGHVSESTLKSRFKMVYGMTMTSYMSKERMEYAKELLSTTDLLIVEISEACGYENHSRFSLAFKKRYKLSPMEYRQETSTDINNGSRIKKK